MYNFGFIYNYVPTSMYSYTDILYYNSKFYVLNHTYVGTYRTHMHIHIHTDMCGHI